MSASATQSERWKEAHPSDEHAEESVPDRDEVRDAEKVVVQGRAIDQDTCDGSNITDEDLSYEVGQRAERGPSNCSADLDARRHRALRLRGHVLGRP